MSVQVGGMIAAGIVVLAWGLLLARTQLQSASGSNRFLLLGPVFEAAALAIFAAEHFLMARALMTIVPSWLPDPLFWTYLVGVALLAAAISFVLGRWVNWSASLLALLFLLIVATIDLHTLPRHLHERLFWTLTVRELAFAGGAMALAGSQWPRPSSAGKWLRLSGRFIVASVLIFYAVEHFLFPHFVPGVPLEKAMPTWMPAPILFSYIIGAVLLLAGFGPFFRRAAPIAASSAGTMLLLLTAFFYLPILLMEIHSPLAIEGINYVGDTMLFGATVLLAGFGTDTSPRLT